MANDTSLVVFYSRTGFTRTVAEALASALGADLEELVDTKNRAGVLGYLRAQWDGGLRRLTQLHPMGRDPAGYELVVIGTPVWMGSMSSPVRTFLAQYRAALKRVAFFCTYLGSGPERTFRHMAAACGKTPLATMAVRDREVRSALQDARIRELVGRVQEAAAAR